MRATHGVLFDLDGTLVDSRRDLAEAVNATLARRGLAPLSLDEVVARIGFGARELVRRSLVAAGGSTDDLVAALAEFYDHYRQHCTRHTTLYPGVVDGLEELRRAGCALAVVTNKPEEFSLRVLEHLGIARFFRVVIGGDSVATKKPDPLPLLVALQRLGLERGAAVMVGDSETDLESARRAAVRFVAVSYGFRDRATLEGLGAEHVVDCFADLIDDLDCGGAEKL